MIFQSSTIFTRLIYLQFPVRSTISSAVVLLRGAISDLATTQITSRAREIFWEKRISQEYEFTMYNWDFCDQNMSLARLVRWVPPSAALGLLIRIRIGLKGGGLPRCSPQGPPHGRPY